MKIKPRIHSWSPVIRQPDIPPINMIFERINRTTNSNIEGFTNTALLYQDILKYAIEHNGAFGFTKLGNWLIDNNKEFHNYYVDSKAHTMGHDLGVSESYWRPTDREILEDYLKAVSLLTINGDNIVLQKQVAELTEKSRDTDYMIKAKLQEKDDALITLSDQVMKLMTEVQDLKKQNLS